jgi:putative oxidoreductase
MFGSVRNSIAGLLDRISPYAFVPLRVFAGLAFMSHGWPKVFDAERFARFSGGVADMGFPAPALFAWAAGLSELVGGLLIALGLLTRPAALFCVITMVVAAFIRHAEDPFARKEKALLFLFVFLGYLVMGAGRLSLDGLIRRWRGKGPPERTPVNPDAGTPPAPARRAAP